MRQQNRKPPGKFNKSLADFIAPKASGIKDYLGVFIVTTGLELDKLVNKYEAEYDDYSSIMAKALADRLAEAYAEYLHQEVRRKYWSYAKDEQLTHIELIQEKYRGIRPAPGYPACPDHTEKQLLFKLLEPENKIGVTLTESMAMWPAASVCGFYYSHPDSEYFVVGKINEDQVKDYAQRKQDDYETMMKWLGSNVGFE